MEETTDATTTKHWQQTFHFPISDKVIKKNVEQTFHFPISDKVIKKNVESEIDMLRMDELKGGTIDLQVYLGVRKPD